MKSVNVNRIFTGLTVCILILGSFLPSLVAKAADSTSTVDGTSTTTAVHDAKAAGDSGSIVSKLISVPIKSIVSKINNLKLTVTYPSPKSEDIFPKKDTITSPAVFSPWIDDQDVVFFPPKDVPVQDFIQKASFNKPFETAKKNLLSVPENVRNEFNAKAKLELSRMSLKEFENFMAGFEFVNGNFVEASPSKKFSIDVTVFLDDLKLYSEKPLKELITDIVKDLGKPKTEEKIRTEFLDLLSKKLKVDVTTNEFSMNELMNALLSYNIVKTKEGIFFGILRSNEFSIVTSADNKQCLLSDPRDFIAKNQEKIFIHVLKNKDNLKRSILNSSTAATTASEKLREILIRTKSSLINALKEIEKDYGKSMTRADFDEYLKKYTKIEGFQVEAKDIKPIDGFLTIDGENASMTINCLAKLNDEENFNVFLTFLKNSKKFDSITAANFEEAVANFFTILRTEKQDEFKSYLVTNAESLQSSSEPQQSTSRNGTKIAVIVICSVASVLVIIIGLVLWHQSKKSEEKL